MALVEKYRQRKYVDDIDYIKGELKGINGLLESLDVTLEKGISLESIADRTEVFGTNHKDPPGRTPFLTLLLDALDDFMLKLLLVCACISIAVDMGFAAEKDRSHAWVEGFSIFLAVAVVSLVSSVSDYQKEG
jgi:magnesium-transporting ATPase (P-type)